MGYQKWNDIKRQRFSDEELADIRSLAATDLITMKLAQLRKHLELTQNDLQDKSGLTQSQISKIENSKDFLLSTIRRYIEALGGQLELHAVIDGTRIDIDLLDDNAISPE